MLNRAPYQLPHEAPLHALQHAVDTAPLKKKAACEAALAEKKRAIMQHLTPWQRVQIARCAARPKTSDYIAQCSHFYPLHGDGMYRDDPAIVGGFATIGTHRCVIVGQEKGSDTESRQKHNFGMAHPEGFRKAARLFQLSARWQLPLVLFVDTPGAFPGLEAEQRGQGRAIAHNLQILGTLKTPIVVCYIGEGSSGGALACGIGDRILMLEHAYFSVISPEGCAAILWKSRTQRPQAAEALQLTSEALAAQGWIDRIIEEPLGGAHHAPLQMCERLSGVLQEELAQLRATPIEKLLVERFRRYRGEQ